MSFMQSSTFSIFSGALFTVNLIEIPSHGTTYFQANRCITILYLFMNEKHILMTEMYFVFSLKILETEKIVHKIVANAGKNISLVCSGIDDKTKIETLTWKTTQTIIKYVNGKPLDQNQRVSCKAFLLVLLLCIYYYRRLDANFV